MAIKSKEELLASIKNRFGEDTSDDALSLYEDLSDTITDFENKAKGDGVDWKKKYEDNDRDWREKYRDRFFNGGSDEDDKDDPLVPPVKKQYKFEDLFKEV
jgi:hypothetical protein